MKLMLRQSIFTEKQKKGMAAKIEGIFKCGVETSSESTF